MIKNAHILSEFSGLPVIVGSGIAGLSVALHLKRPCVLLTDALLGNQSASKLAQGGIAAAVGQDDSIELHIQDTLKAGAGLCEESVVEHIISAAPNAIEELLKWGVPFSYKNGRLDLHLEAAHSRKRILHSKGDQSGAEIIKTLSALARHSPHISILENTAVLGLGLEDGHVTGVLCDKGYIPTEICVLATGGVAGLYNKSTAPFPSQGWTGIALAAKAGAQLENMEFTQFHPTALNIKNITGNLPLVSEAVRGAGAQLIDETGERFVDELQSRDKVARAVAFHEMKGHQVFLNTQTLKKGTFSQHFPSIAATCRKYGIDPDSSPIPVCPAMHYYIGGVSVDQNARSSVAGLWACGEVACTGLHGANRLASNSLLEGFVTGQDAAKDIDNTDSSLKPGSKANGQVISLQGSPAPHALNEMLNSKAGLLRNKEGLQDFLLYLKENQKSDQAMISAFIATSALRRTQSLGCHWRTDSPLPESPVITKNSAQHFKTILTYQDLF